MIESKKELENVLPILNNCKFVGVDLESSMPKRFGREISLIQIGNNEFQFLIDTEKFFPEDLFPIFENKNIQKIFFDCHQDIILLKEHYGCEINNIFDVSAIYLVLLNQRIQVGLDKVLLVCPLKKLCLNIIQLYFIWLNIIISNFILETTK